MGGAASLARPDSEAARWRVMCLRVRGGGGGQVGRELSRLSVGPGDAAQVLVAAAPVCGRGCGHE